MERCSCSAGLCLHRQLRPQLGLGCLASARLFLHAAVGPRGCLASGSASSSPPAAGPCGCLASARLLPSRGSWAREVLLRPRLFLHAAAGPGVSCFGLRPLPSRRQLGRASGVSCLAPLSSFTPAAGHRGCLSPPFFAELVLLPLFPRRVGRLPTWGAHLSVSYLSAFSLALRGQTGYIHAVISLGKFSLFIQQFSCSVSLSSSWGSCEACLDGDPQAHQAPFTPFHCFFLTVQADINNFSSVKLVFFFF